MALFNRLVSIVIKQSDIILIIVDARNIEASRNKTIEDRIQEHGKKFLYVINKVDLLSKEGQKSIALGNSVQVSATRHLGTMRLLRKIMKLAKGENVVVGVVGLPNTGKSTLINALKGSHAAPTSPVSGFTKSLQKIRISRSIVLFDTPGVLGEDRPENIALGAVDVSKIDDPEHAAMQLIQAMNGKVEKFYGTKVCEDALETLGKIALKKHVLKKKGLPDTERIAREIIIRCQKGEIR